MNSKKHRVRILTVQEFAERFGTDRQCVEHLTRMRWQEGFSCPACGHAGSSYVATRRLHQCTACRRQTSLTADTIFHKTRVPLRKWFWALYRMGQDKKGISAMMLRKEIGVSYEWHCRLQPSSCHAVTFPQVPLVTDRVGVA